MTKSHDGKPEVLSGAVTTPSIPQAYASAHPELGVDPNDPNLVNDGHRHVAPRQPIQPRGITPETVNDRPGSDKSAEAGL